MRVASGLGPSLKSLDASDERVPLRLSGEAVSARGTVSAGIALSAILAVGTVSAGIALSAILAVSAGRTLGTLRSLGTLRAGGQLDLIDVGADLHDGVNDLVVVSDMGLRTLDSGGRKGLAPSGHSRLLSSCSGRWLRSHQGFRPGRRACPNRTRGPDRSNPRSHR